LTASLASVNCGDDDTSGTTGAAGSGGKAGSAATGGRGGTAGTSATAGAGGTATGGTGGTGGSGNAGAGTAGTAGTGGRGGTAGAGGTAGSGGQTEGGAGSPIDGGTDAPRPDATDAGDGSTPDVSTTPDTSVPDAPSADAPDGAVTFAAVATILRNNCTGCHRPRDTGAQLFDFDTAAGLYDRLIAPLPDNQEGTCGFGDAGTDGGDGGRPNRRAITPGDPGGSLLFLKIAGTQPPGNPPAGCGQRMPRVPVTGADGGPAGSVGCDQADGGTANCLSQEQIDTFLRWIEQGAPNN
jgi:hypothetical protein